MWGGGVGLVGVEAGGAGGGPASASVHACTPDPPDPTHPTAAHRAPQYLPGLIATLALVMINCVRRDEVAGLDPYGGNDEGAYARSRAWLFLSYLVSFGSVAGAVLLFLKHPSSEGAAAIAQVVLILGAALTLFITRGLGDGEGGLYEAF